MPPPFPGVDPFLESQGWEGFHTSFITVLRDLLVPRVRPKYLVDVERYVYVSDDDEEIVQVIAPDVFAAETGHGWRDYAGSAATAVTLTPVTNRIPLPKRRQAFLTIRTRQSRVVVAVIELLSPWNKTRERGLTEYLNKRENVLYSTANLVELDLLRGGTRLPTAEPLQSGDYFAFVSRSRWRPDVDVYGWSLRDPLPTIPIPLAEGDADVPLDLQEAFATTYERAGYDYSLDYRAPVQPPLSEEDAAWVAARLAASDPTAKS